MYTEKVMDHFQHPRNMEKSGTQAEWVLLVTPNVVIS